MFLTYLLLKLLSFVYFTSLSSYEFKSNDVYIFIYLYTIFIPLKQKFHGAPGEEGW